MTDHIDTPTEGEIGMRTTRFGQICVYLGLVIIYLWFGSMKFTQYEANGLQGLVEPSVLIGWMYEIFSVRGFAIFLGFIELTICVLIALRLFSPKFSVVGGLLSCGLFVTTISFMFTTKGVFAPEELSFPAISVMPGQFLLKDIGLLGASILVVGESISADARNRAV